MCGRHKHSHLRELILFTIVSLSGEDSALLYGRQGGVDAVSTHKMALGNVFPCTLAIVHEYAGRRGWYTFFCKWTCHQVDIYVMAIFMFDNDGRSLHAMYFTYLAIDIPSRFISVFRQHNRACLYILAHVIDPACTLHVIR